MFNVAELIEHLLESSASDIRLKMLRTLSAVLVTGIIGSFLNKKIFIILAQDKLIIVTCYHKLKLIGGFPPFLQAIASLELGY